MDVICKIKSRCKENKKMFDYRNWMKIHLLQGERRSI